MRHILCYGDSNTWGAIPMKSRADLGRFPLAERWPSVMGATLGGNVRNAVEHQHWRQGQLGIAGSKEFAPAAAQEIFELETRPPLSHRLLTSCASPSPDRSKPAGGV